jgi:hypothetical protein
MAKEDEQLIAYCGLYCGDCFGYKGKVADLARDLRKELRESKFDKFADFISNENFGKVYKDYDKCYNVLGAMVKFRCRKGCKNGGGPPFCKIRKCNQRKGFEGCWECEDFEECNKLDFLAHVHGDAHIKNLRRLKRKGPTEFVKGKHEWYSTPKTKKSK